MVIYISSLFKVIERHLPQVHCFADETQLYFSFKANDDNANDVVLRAMEECIRDLRKWLVDGTLLLKDDNTYFKILIILDFFHQVTSAI